MRADLQMVMDEVVLNSGAAYLEELEVMNETLLQPASDAVNGWLNKIRHLEGVTSTSKERLLRLGETLEGLYKALEEKVRLLASLEGDSRKHTASHIMLFELHHPYYLI